MKVSGPFLIGEYCALLVHVTPVQYNPAKKKLVGYGDLTVTIEVARKPGDAPLSAPSNNKRASSGGTRGNGDLAGKKFGRPNFPLICPTSLEVFE